MVVKEAPSTPQEMSCHCELRVACPVPLPSRLGAVSWGCGPFACRVEVVDSGHSLDISTWALRVGEWSHWG